MTFVLALAAIFDIMIGFAMMGAGNSVASGLGLFFVILGFLGFLPIFSMSSKNERVSNLSSVQNKDYDKYIKGKNILKRYYDLGITNVNDISNKEERNQVQKILNFCLEYEQRQENLAIAYKEKEKEDFTTGASIAAGVALGSVLSGAISKHMNESHQRTMERIRKNISRHNS